MAPRHGTVERPGEGPRRSPICAAPFVAMEFDPFGDVQACCANTLYPLGNVGRSSLREIWEGPRAQELRRALNDGDLSMGCSVCRYRLTYGYGELARDYYDNFPMPAGEPEWPFSLQFSLHNTCNLECVMCGADRSSRIRRRRAHLEPLPHVYDDRFFAELEPFLAHCGAVDLSGGEPFLVPEHARVWDLLIAMDHRPLCSLTTNGTIWNDRVERVLDFLDTHISVSVDGMTPTTFESIRVGARFDVVMANLDRFLAYTRERGTILTMSWSLVRGNWWELGEAMRFAEERGIHLKVQTVIEPEFGLQRLPTPELRFIVEALEAEGSSLEPELELNLAMWQREVRRLREELELRSVPGLRPLCMEPAHPDNAPHVAAMVLDGSDRRVAAERLDHVEAEALADLARWCPGSPVGEIDVDRSGALTSVSLDHVLPVPHDPAALDLVALLRSLETPGSGPLWIGEEFPEGDRLVQTVSIGRPVRDKAVLVLRMVSITHDRGVRILVARDTTLLPEPLPGVAVQLGPPRGTVSARWAKVDVATTAAGRGGGEA